jgi:hypothetical protein
VGIPKATFLSVAAVEEDVNQTPAGVLWVSASELTLSSSIRSFDTSLLLDELLDEIQDSVALGLDGG